MAQAELPNSSDTVEALAMLAAIIESSDDAIISKDLNGIVTSWNRGAEGIFGYTAGEMIGQPVALLVPPERPDEEPRILERLRRGERVDHFETVRVRKDGRRIDVSVTISPIYDAQGRIIGASKIARDITAQKRLEADLQERNEQIHVQNEELEMQNEELAAQNEELAEADRRKNEYLAMLAHELRNPLAPVLNSVHILRSRSLADPALHRHTEIIHRQVRHMARLLDGLLDVSRLSRGAVLLRREHLDLGTLVNNAVRDLEDYIEERGHELSVHVPAGPVFVEGDPVRLDQVVTNLVNNAAKFTGPGGSIRVTVEVEGSHALFRVKDTGIGIDRRLLPRIFDLFTQADQGLARAQGGLGVGLTIVRSLVELHGGSIEARSPGPGQGSEFIVRLPLYPSKTRTEKTGSLRGPAASPPGRVRRVLIVDDNRDGADTLAELIGEWGYEARTAYDAVAALDLAAEQHPEVVLLDIGMPEMNGYEVAAALRAIPGMDGVALVAVTGYGTEEDRRRARDAGFDAHLVKPVDPEEVRQLLQAGVS